MTKLITVAQLVAWILASAFFLVQLLEKVEVKVVNRDIVAQLEMQVNYEPEVIYVAR